MRWRHASLPPCAIRCAVIGTARARSTRRMQSPRVSRRRSTWSLEWRRGEPWPDVHHSGTSQRHRGPVTSHRFRPSPSCEAGIRTAIVCQRAGATTTAAAALRRRMSTRSPFRQRHPDEDEQPRERLASSSLRHSLFMVGATPRRGNDSRCGASPFPRGEIVSTSTLSPRLSSPSPSNPTPPPSAGAGPFLPPEACDQARDDA